MVIKALDNQQSTEQTLVPSHPFCLAISGQIASGKSTLLINLCREKLRGEYNRGIIVSPTIRMDHKMQLLTKDPSIFKGNQALADAIWREARQYDENEPRMIVPAKHGFHDADIHETYEHSLIEDVMKAQRDDINTYGRDVADKILLIIEDAPSAGIFQKKHSDIFNKFCLVLRHYNTSIIMCVQLFYAIPKIIRSNLTCIFIFGCNDREAKELCDEISVGLTRARFHEILQLLTHKQYSFLQINRKNRPGFRVIKGLDEFIA